MIIKRGSNKKSPTKRNQAAANNENVSPFKKSGSPLKTPFENDNKHNKENSPSKQVISPVKIGQDSSIQRPFADATNSPVKGIQPFGVKFNQELAAKVNSFDVKVAALANLKQRVYDNLDSVEWLQRELQLEANGPVDTLKKSLDDSPAKEAVVPSPEGRTPLKKPAAEDDVNQELPIFNDVAEFDEPGLSVIPTDSDIVAT